MFVSDYNTINYKYKYQTKKDKEKQILRMISIVAQRFTRMTTIKNDDQPPPGKPPRQRSAYALARVAAKRAEGKKPFPSVPRSAPRGREFWGR